MLASRLGAGRAGGDRPVGTITTDEFGGGLGCSLREAIQSVNTNANFGGCTGAGDVISLPAGTYTLTGAANEDDNASGDLDVKSNLTIYGAGSKTTIIQAGTNATNGVDRVMHIFDGYTVEINDVTIRYGKAPDGIDGASGDACTGGDGGGIYSQPGSTLTLNACFVRQNRSGNGGDCSPGGWAGYGGGIYSDGGTLILNDTSVLQNEGGAGGDGGAGSYGGPGGAGGGIYIGNSSVMTLTRSTVAYNVSGSGGNGGNAMNSDAGDGIQGSTGGGIYNNASTLTLIESTVNNNATGAGGNGGSVTSGNGDGGDGGDGGYGAGIYVINGTASTMAVDTTIRDNVTGPAGSPGTGAGTGSAGTAGFRGYGGGIVCSGGWTVCTLSNSTISGNAAHIGGGVSFVSGAYVVMTNSTVSGNGADMHGGGIYNNGGTATLTHVTVADNTADVDNDGNGAGGGLFISNNSVTMTNTIVAVNYDKGGESPDCWGTVTSGDYNLLGIGDSTGCTFASQPHDQVGTAASPLNPVLRVLANYGGSTETHALHPTSPAVDQIPAGVNGCAVGSRDQRGVLRFPPCDIGAYEIDPESVYLPLVVSD